MRGSIFALFIAFAETASASPAIDVGGGITSSLGDNQWDEPGVDGKLAVRAWNWLPRREIYLGADWSRRDVPYRDRMRVVAGALLERASDDPDGWLLSARVGGGLDLLRVVEGPPPDIITGGPGGPTRVRWDPGLTAEIGGTALLGLGRVAVGLDLGFPVAVHHGGCGSESACLDYVSLDAEVLVVVRVR